MNAEIRRVLDEIEQCSRAFERFMRSANSERKRGKEDSEESLRNKANEQALMIVARTRKLAAQLPALPPDSPAIVAGYDATFWHESYTMLRDAVTTHLDECIHEDDVAEEAILVEAIETAGQRLRSLPAALPPDDPPAGLKAHTRAVADFLNDLYAIMVDPCADGTITVDELQAALRAAALRDREAAFARGVACHAAAPVGYRCSDCTIDQEACPMCYAVWWKRRHAHHEVVPLSAGPAAPRLQDETEDAKSFTRNGKTENPPIDPSTAATD